VNPRRFPFVALFLVAAAPAAAQPKPPGKGGVEDCPTTGPVWIFTENLTPSRGDLCASYHRAVDGISLAAIPAGQVYWRIRLDSLARLQPSPSTQVVECKVYIEAITQRGPIGFLRTVSSAPLVPQANLKDVQRKCVDGALRTMVTKLAKDTASSLAASPLPPPLTAPPPPPAPSKP
jgi:hypothetical protein